MTPQERQLVAELFERLASLEATPRDRDAERAIADGLARAPKAVYPLVQTVLVQDEALKRADARIRELEGGDEAPRAGGFLDNMRDALTGRREPPRGSVPTVRPGTAAQPDPRWNSAAQAPGGPGGSFLGTAAAAAAGVIGGSLLLGGIQSMFGRHGNASAAYDPSASGQSPWGGSASASDLAREAGVDDIAHSGQRGVADDRAARLLDNSNDGGSDGGGDLGGGDLGDGDLGDGDLGGGDLGGGDSA